MSAAWWDPYVDGAAWMDAYNKLEAQWAQLQDRYVADVNAFVDHLRRMRAALDHAQPLLRTDTDRANWSAHQRVYLRLVAPVLADSQSDAPQVGAIPVAAVAIIVGGLALTVWGIAWAVEHLADASTAWKSLSLWEKDLEARRWAAEHGKTLAPSTLPGTVPDPTRPNPLFNYEDNAPDGDSEGGALWLLAALGLAAAGGAWAYSSSKR